MTATLRGDTLQQAHDDTDSPKPQVSQKVSSISAPSLLANDTYDTYDSININNIGKAYKRLKTGNTVLKEGLRDFFKPSVMCHCVMKGDVLSNQSLLQQHQIEGLDIADGLGLRDIMNGAQWAQPAFR